jgi:SAM-dependent methyltransferase
MLNPAKSRSITADPLVQVPLLTRAEKYLNMFGISLVGKNILDIGCGYGNLCYAMAKYEGTKVHGIDVDEYTVNQSPDLNLWNPEDIKFVHNKLDEIRLELSKKFPMSVCNKCTFQTCGIENYVADKPHDVIVSWDVLEHILNLEQAFGVMAHSLKKGGVMFHEYNPFFSLTGGHTLCTLDFPYGHCRLSKEDFESYIRELRPNEEKIALNFYNKCLNRVSLVDVKKYAKQYGFEILNLTGNIPFGASEEEVRKELSAILLDVKKLYPSVEIEDLLWDGIFLVMRRL